MLPCERQAASAPLLDFTVVGHGAAAKLRIEYENVSACTVSFFCMDLE